MDRSKNQSLDFSVDGIVYRKAAGRNGVQVLCVVGKRNNAWQLIVPSHVRYDGHRYDVTSIGEGAFMGCTNLTEVFIPKTVCEVGNNAFGQCSGIKTVKVAKVMPPSSFNEAFDSLTYQTARLLVPEKCTMLYMVNDGWRAFSNIVENHGTPSPQRFRTAFRRLEGIVRRHLAVFV